MKKILSIFAAVVFSAAAVCSGESLPKAPEKYFNDYAGIVSEQESEQLNQKLADIDKSTTNEIVVAVYRTIDSEGTIEEVAVKLFEQWKIGKKEKDNGVLFLVLLKDNNGQSQMRVEVGYGLEPVLPDMVCKRILEDTVKPFFQTKEFAKGFDAGISEIAAQAQKEVSEVEQQQASPKKVGIIAVILIVVVVFIIMCFAFGPAVAIEVLFDIIILVLSSMGSGSGSSGRSGGGRSGGGGSSSRF